MPVITSGSFNSFAGADITAGIDVPVLENGRHTFKHYIFGELQTISYSLYTPARPVRAMGYRGPKGFTKGTRLVAGTLVFIVFDRHVIYDILQRPDPVVTLMDELPPFHVTVVFNNEYGHKTALRILGVSIIEEGQVMSVEDIYTEQTMRYVARDMVPMHPQLL